MDSLCLKISSSLLHVTLTEGKCFHFYSSTVILWSVLLQAYPRDDNKATLSWPWVLCEGN